MSERFPLAAATHKEARDYYVNRAIQMLHTGWQLTEPRNLASYGVEAEFLSPDLVKHKSVFILEGHIGQGHGTKWFEDHPGVPFVTSELCPRMKAWLDHKRIDYTLLEAPEGRAYSAVESFYGDGRANRSGLFLMNHIDEGLYILGELGATLQTKDAWCLHPLLQSDYDLQATLAAGGHLNGQAPAAMLIAMEYRHQANGHLSHHEPKVPTFGPLDEVRQMLIADKVQNRKDFDQHLRGKVANSDRLDSYFQEWFAALEIPEPWYAKVADHISTTCQWRQFIAPDGEEDPHL